MPKAEKLLRRCEIKKEEVLVNSREIVKRAIGFKKPERIPFFIPFLGTSDICSVWLRDPANWKPRTEGENEWGTVWKKPDPSSGIKNMGQVSEYPIKEAGEIDNYKPPDPFDDSRYEGLEERIENAGDKYRLFGWFTLFERAWQLRGMENLFLDFYENQAGVEKLLDKIKDFIMGVLEKIEGYKGKLDGFRLGDDWGDQRGPLINPDIFRKFFKPRYEEIISKAHSLGMDVWLHSDGKINELIEDFIEIGLNVINLQQPRLVGIEDISKRYRGRITFETHADIQKTLPLGSKGKIEEEVKLLLEKWATPEGGFIAADYGASEDNHIAIGVSRERVQWMLDAYRKYGGLE